MIRIIILLGFIIGAPNVFTQVSVTLRLDSDTPTTVGQLLFCDANYNCGIPATEARKLDLFGKDKTEISVQRTGGDFLVSVDTNHRRGLADEKKLRLANGSFVVIKIRKEVFPGRSTFLPYIITHERVEKTGKPVDSFFLRAHYVLAGSFRHTTCSLPIALNDINADGEIEPKDGDRGTNLQIDRNHDGKFWGKGEFASTNEIIELCGQNYIVSSISYGRITFKQTTLKLAKINEKVPDFSFALMDGSKVSPTSMNGQAYILDFWASWCIPCVENLPDIRKLRDELKSSVEVFSVNVDDGDRRTLVDQIIRSNELAEFTSIRGLGSRDSLWQVFGGANINHLAIPLYVLIDGDGIVRYSGNGGAGLADLRKAVNRMK